MTASPKMQYSIDAGVAHIVLDRPERLNAVDFGTGSLRVAGARGARRCRPERCRRCHRDPGCRPRLLRRRRPRSGGRGHLESTPDDRRRTQVHGNGRELRRTGSPNEHSGPRCRPRSLPRHRCELGRPVRLRRRRSGRPIRSDRRSHRSSRCGRVGTDRRRGVGQVPHPHRRDHRRAPGSADRVGPGGRRARRARGSSVRSRRSYRPRCLASPSS